MLGVSDTLVLTVKLIRKHDRYAADKFMEDSSPLLDFLTYIGRSSISSRCSARNVQDTSA